MFHTMSQDALVCELRETQLSLTPDAHAYLRTLIGPTDIPTPEESRAISEIYRMLRIIRAEREKRGVHA